MAIDTAPKLDEQLTTVVDENLGADVDRTVAETGDGYRLSVADRQLDVVSHKGPDGSRRWVLSLAVDGATVGKYGPYESTDALGEQIRTILTSDGFYTVCCDGEPMADDS